jgi:hypothetical protein
MWQTRLCLDRWLSEGFPPSPGRLGCRAECAPPGGACIGNVAVAGGNTLLQDLADQVVIGQAAEIGFPPCPCLAGVHR